MKCTSLSGFGLDPNLSAMAMDYTTTNGEPDTGTRIFFLIMQALEYFKDSFLMLRFNADTVVPDGKVPFVPNA